MFSHQNIIESLAVTGWDGWLLYDFRKTNDLACRLLDIPQSTMLTRRFFYWIPRQGEPIKIIHRIEKHVLDHLPGKTLLYSSWEELEKCLATVLHNCVQVAMEYSPRNAIPTVSKVDAGTIELVESFGPKVVSSADLLQSYTSVWTEVQLRSHLEAAEVLENSVDKAWRFIAEHIKQNKPLSEREVQSFLLKEFDKQECRCDDPPICAVNAHAADPHYSPDKEKETFIKSGDFVLIDLWCRKKYPQAVYADITRVGVVDNMPTQEQQHIFSLVKQAREAAMTLLKKRIELKEPIMGCEVDQACRDVITQAGFGPYFTHRTGHNIGERDHGDGANIDNFETKDTRHLLPGTCFSIEPGIYLPGKFGVRLENNVFLERDGRGLRVTGGTQENIVCLL